MHTYYATAPSAAAQPLFDGNSYINTKLHMCTLSDGRQSVCEGSTVRMMRISHHKNGIAYAQLGKAGDAIACTTNLPFGVVCEHVDDHPLAQFDGQYVVLNEHTLGFIHRLTPRSMDVLHGSVLKGGHDWKNGPVAILPGFDKVRPATVADFNEYRVCPPAKLLVETTEALPAQR